MDRKTYSFCPVSDRKINERAARINAFFTVIAITLFAITQNILFMVFLGADFWLRASYLKKYSPFAFLSRKAVTLFTLDNKFINEGPKVFAARVGFVLTGIIILLFTLNLSTSALVVAAILFLFSFLEAVFGICVACVIYPYLYKLTYKQTYSSNYL